MDKLILKAVSDETRLKLLLRISRGEVCACILPVHVRTSQPAVSQHLRLLLEAGLVEVRPEGAKRLYSLSGKGERVLRDIRRW